MEKIEIELKYIGPRVSTSLIVCPGDLSVALYQNVWQKIAICPECLVELIDREHLFEVKPFNFNVVKKIPERLRKKQFEFGFDGGHFYKREVARRTTGKVKEKIDLTAKDLTNLEFYKT